MYGCRECIGSSFFRDKHLIRLPEELTPEFKWTWSGVSWDRIASWSQQDLESWVGATTDAATPAATNQYLFSAAGNVPSFTARTAVRWQIVLVASALVLGIGLLLIYIPLFRRAGSLFVVGVVSLAIAAWLPDAAILFSQAAVLGIALALISALLHRMMGRHRVRSVVVTGKSNSVIDRSKATSKSRPRELVGTASTLSAPTPIDVPAVEPNDE